MRKHLLFLTTLLIPIIAEAAPQGVEGRNSAMGGTGVASSDYLSASFKNPALLTRRDESDDFGLLLPVVGVLAADSDDLVDDIDDFQDSLEDIQDNWPPAPGDLDALWNDLNDLNGKSLNLGVGFGLAVAVPAKGLQVAAFVNSYMDAQGSLVVDPADEALIKGAVAAGDLDNLGSEAIILAAAVTDVGCSLAREFDLGGSSLAVGVSPKFQRVDTFNYTIDVNTFDDDDFDSSKYSDDDSEVNLDVGFAWSRSGPLTIGLAARNLIENDYRTKLISGKRFVYRVSPLVTAGAAYRGRLVTLAADVDITETERFVGSVGSADDSRYLRFGAELNAWDWAQLRAGFEHDMEDTTEDLLTAGIGLSPWDVFHLDIAGMIGEGDTYGAVIQTSFTF